MEMLRFSCEIMNLENVFKLDSIVCSFPVTLGVFFDFRMMERFSALSA